MSGQYYLTRCGSKYLIKQPPPALRAKAQVYYEEILDKNRFSNWITQPQCLAKLINMGVLSPTYSQELSNLNKTLDNLKLDLYHSGFNEKKMKNLKRLIGQTKNKLERLYSNMSLLRPFTLEGYASLCRQEFLWLNSVYTLDDRLVFNSLNVDSALAYRIFSSIADHTLSMEQYRTIAKHPEWYNYWKIVQMNSTFPLCKDLTEEQIYLLNFSKMYDSVYESYDCPSSEIIQDDDMLDGWFVEQSRKREKEKRESMASKLSAKHSNADEIFVVANSEQDRQRIAAMNSAAARATKQERTRLLKQKGEAKDSELLRNKLKRKNTYGRP